MWPQRGCICLGEKPINESKDIGVWCQFAQVFLVNCVENSQILRERPTHPPSVKNLDASPLFPLPYPPNQP